MEFRIISHAIKNVSCCYTIRAPGETASFVLTLNSSDVEDATGGFNEMKINFDGKMRGQRVRCSAVEVENDIDDEACELVNGVELSIGEGDDDNIQAFLLKAVKNNNGTVSLFLTCFVVIPGERGSQKPCLHNGWLAKILKGLQETLKPQQNGWMDLSAASKVKVLVLFISGDNNPLCPVSVLNEFEKGTGRGSKVVIFKGRGHAFAHRPGSPEEDVDAEQAL
ncbi:hypothetical protein CCACVL1_03745 [Corchorus capsularis]|uniref:Uncharacterized protein n=1 Tax=Corchorus capsularis TaxID=210143 RepID=A0A1R3JXE1_COCAP|nr:hypothetical protein CCACVL1_03745 [Corchorus capsularis]